MTLLFLHLQGEIIINTLKFISQLKYDKMNKENKTGIRFVKSKLKQQCSNSGIANLDLTKETKGAKL